MRKVKNRKTLKVIIGISGAFLILLITGSVLFYHKEKEQTLNDVQAKVDFIFLKEMNARRDSMLSKNETRFFNDGRLRKPYPFSVYLATEKGRETFIIDSISDCKNITPFPQVRITHSISLMQNPFKVDSFYTVCTEILKQSHLYVNLCFEYRNRSHYETVGDTLSAHPLMDYTIGYGNEYSLKAGVHIPFFFSRSVYLIFGVVFLYVLVSGSVILYRYRTVRTLYTTQQEDSEKTGVDLPQTTFVSVVCYVRSEQIFYLPDQTTVSLTRMEALIFESIYNAPNHSLLSSDLQEIGWNDVGVTDNARNARMHALRKKLEKIEGLAIEYSKSTKRYTLVIEDINLELSS